ncbi:MAG TPA: hypothetical protein VGQ83_24120 [Polyangia bacterium]|jgi:hypothetical protein
MGRWLTLSILLLPLAALGWPRPRYEDVTVVERAELIVVGRLAPGSVRYVPHARRPQQGRSWEHHATLRVTRVLKGALTRPEIPVVIHYGLDPVVGGRIERDGFMLDVRRGRLDYPQDRIAIVDTGSGTDSVEPLVADAAADNLWFLRHHRDARDLGIVDPQDLQPLGWEAYFRAYLTKEPEPAVSAALQGRAAPVERAQRYLDHRQILRIQRIPDPAVRAQRLASYFVRRVRFGSSPEAEQALIACGPPAGPALLPLFTQPPDAAARTDIIRVWGAIHYGDAVPLLIQLLAEHDRFWASQRLPHGWWNREPDAAATQLRRRVYGEIHQAVTALGAIGDPRARAVLELTRRRWRGLDREDPRIARECERALRRLKSR